MATPNKFQPYVDEVRERGLRDGMAYMAAARRIHDGTLEILRDCKGELADDLKIGLPEEEAVPRYLQTRVEVLRRERETIKKIEEMNPDSKELAKVGLAVRNHLKLSFENLEKLANKHGAKLEVPNIE